MMPSLRYIFIGDQGQVFSSSDEPTTEDFAYAAVGMMTIISIADARYYGLGKRWLPIQSGRLGTANIDGKETPSFHAPESFFQETQSQG